MPENIGYLHYSLIKLMAEKFIKVNQGNNLQTIIISIRQFMVAIHTTQSHKQLF